jgi:hypothetical protein
VVAVFRPAEGIGLNIPGDGRMLVIIADDVIVETVVPDVAVERWPPGGADAMTVTGCRHGLEPAHDVREGGRPGIGGFGRVMVVWR